MVRCTRKSIERSVDAMASVPEGRCEPSLLARSLETLAKEVEDARSGLEQRLAVTAVEEFALKEGATRDHLRDCYGKCFKEVGAFSNEPGDKFLDCRPILEEMVKKNYRMPDVRDAYDSLIVAEDNWGEFLQKFEKELSKVHPPYMEGAEFLQQGDSISPDHLALEFTSVATKQVVSLKAVLARSRYTLFLFFRPPG